MHWVDEGWLRPGFTLNYELSTTNSQLSTSCSGHFWNFSLHSFRISARMRKFYSWPSTTDLFLKLHWKYFHCWISSMQRLLFFASETMWSGTRKSLIVSSGRDMEQAIIHFITWTDGNAARLPTWRIQFCVRKPCSQSRKNFSGRLMANLNFHSTSAWRTITKYYCGMCLPVIGKRIETPIHVLKE